MSTARTHIRNLSFNWGGHAATLLVMFFLTPYVVGELDAVSYGIWSLLNVLTGYMGIFDLGVRASVGRHIALYIGKEDPEGVDETIRAGLGFFSLTALLILVVGLAIGWAFPQLFKGVPPEHHHTVRLLLPLMVINVWLAAPASIFSSTLTAYERFDIVRGVDILVLLVRTVGIVTALEFGWDLWGMAVSVILGNFVAIIGNYLCARYLHPKLRIWPFLYSKTRLKEIVGYGLAAFTSAVAVKIVGQTDLIIAGIALGVSSVREYSIGAALATYSATFMALISRTLFPALQKSIARGQIGDAIFFYGRQLRLTLCFAIPVYIGMAVYSEPFIRLWMFQEGFGKNSVLVSAQVMMLLAVSKLPLAFIRPSISFLASSGHVNFTAMMSVIEAVVNLLFSLTFVMLFDWGLAGIALGTIAARLLVPSLWIPWYQSKTLEGRTVKVQIVTFVKALFACCLFTAFCLGFIIIWKPISWPVLFAHAALGLLAWALIGGAILVPTDFRKKVFNYIKGVWKIETLRL